MKFFTLLGAFAVFVAVTLMPITASAQSYPYANQYYSTATTPAYISCNANVPSVRAGQPVIFTSTGGWGGIYNWTTSERTYYNIGPTMTAVLNNPGLQTVTVSAGQQAASCTVNVLPASATASAPVTQITHYPVTYFTAQYIPGLPNTGFEPITATAIGFAAVLLVAAGLFVSPYVKRTLASTFR